MKKSYLLFLFILFNISEFHGQNVMLDSLINTLQTTKEDSIKVKILNDLFIEYEFTDDNKAKEYLDQALELAQKINYSRGLALTYTDLGYFAEDKGNYPEALKNYLSSLKVREKLGDKKGLAGSYNNIGGIYALQANYPEALKNYFISRELYTALGHKQGIAASYNNIGFIYKKQGNYTEALKCFLSTLETSTAIGDKRGMASAYNNIGNIYNALGNYPEALKNCQASLKIRESTGDKAGIAADYNNIGDIYVKQKNYGEAQKYILKAQELSKKIGHKEYLRDSYAALTILDSIKGNYKGAFENHKLYILYRDSLDNEEARKKTIQSQMTYDFEKKEAVAQAEHKKELENQEILANEKGRKQKIVLFFVLGSLLLVLIFAGFIFRSLRVTRRQKNIIEKQKDVVELQKQKVEEQKLLVEEKQKEIIDSITYARRIQRSLLPTEIYIDRTLKRMRKNKV